ncbi:MAG TPA: lipopolysaccharide heptosyltransferase II [Ktedonobacterales bacterium]|jgi:lipopolysaccharide heptosyltransferase II|nr:lipopolysaccharide heptosyltransferase II [Ktedonobacterales bacterium]
MTISAHKPRNSRTPGDAVLDPGYAARAPFEKRCARFGLRMLKRLGQSALRQVLGSIGYLTHQWTDAIAPLRPGDPAIRRILVVRVDLLGDTVLSTPAVRALRRGYPGAAIDMLVQHATAAVLEGDPDISRVIAYNPHIWRRPGAWLRLRGWAEALRLLRTLRSPRYDLAICVSGDVGSIITRLTGARRSVGYAGEAYRHFLTDPLPGRRYELHQHEVRYVLRLAEAAGGIVDEQDAQPRLYLSTQRRIEMRSRLEAGRAQTGVTGPIVAIHAGARNGQAKRWPLAHFATLCEMLVQNLDALVVLTGATNEAPLAQAIEQSAAAPLLNLVGATTLPELVTLLAESDTLVTGDSGPMHIACAVETPVVVLHGPTDPNLSGPTAPDAIVLRRRLWCSPCYDASATAECRFGNPVCMKGIAPRTVFAAVERQLRRHPIFSQATREECQHVAPTPHP